MSHSLENRYLLLRTGFSDKKGIAWHMRAFEPTTIRSLYEFIERLKRKTKNQIVHCHLDDINLYDAYAEPGYETPASGIIAIGNWNSVTIGPDKEDLTLRRLGRMLERRYGVSLEWDDEWSSCDECGKLIRTSPDCYGWTGSYWITDGSIICHECVKSSESSIREYLESYEGHARNAMTIDIDPEEHGYVKLNSQSYENGLHGGQNDAPAAIAKTLRAKGARRILFKIDSKGQFDLDFSVYVHESEYNFMMREPEGKCIDPAEVMKKALSGAHTPL